MAQVSDRPWLPGTAEAVGIYVHIPFCRAICPFCTLYHRPSLTGLRRTAGVLLETIESRYGISVMENFGDELQPFMELGLVRHSHGVLKLTEGEEMGQYRQEGAWRGVRRSRALARRDDLETA